MRNPQTQRGTVRWVLAAGVVVAGAAVLILARPRHVSTQVARAARQELVVSVLCDGVLEPPAQGELRSPAAATVARLRAREGDRVSSGQPMLELDSPALLESLRRAREELARAAADEIAARSDLQREDREVERLRGVVDADRRLTATGAIARSLLEADESAFSGAQARQTAAAAKLDSVARAPGSILPVARNRVDELERRVAALTVRAPFEGSVFSLPRRAGESVVEGQVVAGVFDLGHPRVRIRIDEPDLPRIAAGETFTITFDGLPDRRWSGAVGQVIAGVREVSGRQVGEAIGEIADPERRLPPNASVNVTIIVARAPQALIVPRGALVGQGERRVVYILESGRARRRDVTVGLIGLTEAEIRAGLSEGDRVLIPVSEPLRDGMRVSSGGA